MFGIELIAKLFKILRSDASPTQIAWGFVLGMIIGLTPIWNLHNLLIFILIVLLKVNIGMAIFSFIICSGFAYLIDPLFHDLGYYLLVSLSGMRDFWTTLYNTPIISLSNFNNTVVMGSMVCSVILILPAYILIKKFVIVYREKIDARMQKLKIVQIIKGSKIYNWYEKIKNLGG